MACWRTCTHPHTRAWVHTRIHTYTHAQLQLTAFLRWHMHNNNSNTPSWTHMLYTRSPENSMKDLRQAVDLAVHSWGRILTACAFFDQEWNERLFVAIESALWDVVMFSWGKQLILWVKDMQIFCACQTRVCSDFLEWRGKSTVYFWRSACDAQELWFGLNWQVSIERYLIMLPVVAQQNNNGMFVLTPMHWVTERRDTSGPRSTHLQHVCYSWICCQCEYPNTCMTQLVQWFDRW